VKIIDATAWCSSNRYGDLEFRATMEDGSKDVFVFAWFSDELTFKAEEIVGLTIEEARDLKQKRDIAYLQS
jgi:CRISPR/Cas system CMR-associated protein Cmr3 (group 5 of RAMP superfamily)